MDIESIEQQAQQVISQYNPEYFVPFPFEQLAQSRADIDILYSTKLSTSVSGAIFLTDSRFTILINSTKSNTRQYFTVAHEIAHYFLHNSWLLENSDHGFVDYAGSLDVPGMLLRDDQPLLSPEGVMRERQANNFAAELIMPESKVKEFWRLSHNVDECASTFKVSRVAMAIRLERLGLSE